MLHDQIMVSVYCLAYNHEKYIRDCFEAFVNQKTNFKFEVIVHDDASTDGTADIIKEFEIKYPDIFIPIFQKENQYSKGSSIFNEYILPIVRGKYIAVCEGDDYWTDEYKLQKQFDALEVNEDCVACVHSTRVDNYADKSSFVLRAYEHDCIAATEDVLKKFVPIFHTTSIFFRRRIFQDIPELMNLPEMCWDYSRLVMLALYGKIYYIDNIMSVYRTLLPESWTVRTKEKRNRKVNLNFPKAMIKALKFADKYSNFRYHDLIDKNILEFEYKVWRAEPQF